jgi:threonine/homoserine/homoserine lactone efflux protein
MDPLLPLLSFAFVQSITPGPNNVMLSASGVAFGLRRTLPHLFGVSAGFFLLLVVCGAGVGTLIVELPLVGVALKVGGTAYLLYLAWLMRNAFAPQITASTRPLTFGEAVAFQFVNPKAWIMGVTAASVFVPDVQPRWVAVLLLCTVCALINLPCICTWAVLGASFKRWLAGERLRRWVGGALVALTVYSVVAIWL